MVDFSQRDPYTWHDQKGWRAYRVFRPGRGMYWDVRRRLPYYWSDIKDGFNYQTAVGTVRIFFVNLLPAIAFMLDMQRRTDGFFGLNEALFSSALAALVFSLLSAQPLTVVGITGLISLFNYTIYDIAVDQGIGNLYPEFLAWVGIWAAITHWLASIFNLNDYMRYITDFSSHSFGMYVGIIYMIKGVEELVAQFDENNGGSLSAGYLSVVIALCYWASVYFLEFLGSTTWLTPIVRKMLSDYAYPIATVWWTGFSHIPGRIANTNLQRLEHTRAFYPSIDRSWLIPFWDLPVKWVFVALPIGILITLLFYYDHNVSSLIAQARSFPLTKPAGFNWDFFLLGCTTFISAIIGIPLPNGLVPQAPVHTDACTTYVEKLETYREKDDTENASTQHRRRRLVVPHDTKEQRVSHFIMALLFVGLMTGPLLTVLATMPLGLFCGVFFVVGFSSIQGMGITKNVIFLLSERQFLDPQDPRLTLKRRRIWFYLTFQGLGVAFSVAISQTIGAIGFPVIIIALIPIRWLLLPRIFTKHELLTLDAPTADAPVVMASMGGQPELPEVRLARARGENVDGDGENAGYEAGKGQGAGGSSSGFSEESKERERNVRDRTGVRDTEHLGLAGEKERRNPEGAVDQNSRTGHL
ncbi:hypothetical protein MBLNU230_g6590t1 [Neophaeotheca triangularis]